MKVTATDLPGVLLIEPDVFGDERGYFIETYRHARYAEHGIGARFVQDSLSRSKRGILRGLHMQWPHGQGKLVHVLEGCVFDVAVDVRRGSETFGRWTGHTLSEQNHYQLYIPPGFAHGFLVTSDDALFQYKCTDVYAPECELAIAWNDPDLAIDWPVAAPALSAKDRTAPRLRDIDPDRLPRADQTK
ncbi:MAG: dTDP-4-dehydrorhamnose 3,5-epimerase [Planctomycetota bacterium]|nr:dTDP-4-dehydrorhamnose 3,5-epimerase [Planctomycetota bacterium]